MLSMVLVVAGCGIGPGIQPVPAGETCLEIPEDLCREQIRTALRDLGPNHPPVVGVLVRCTRGPCTRHGGEGETVVAFADGTQTGMGWAFAQALPAPAIEPGPATPLPVEPICLGIPRQACLENTIDDPRAGAGPAILSIVVRCTAVCDDRKGEGTTTFTYADGSTSESEWGYESG